MYCICNWNQPINPQSKDILGKAKVRFSNKITLEMHRKWGFSIKKWGFSKDDGEFIVYIINEMLPCALSRLVVSELSLLYMITMYTD
jgi:hypothetical protein